MSEPTPPSVPLGPFDTAPQIPAGPGSSIAVVRAIWRHALRDLPMGAYDRHLVEFVEGVWDQPMLVTFASLLERARHAGTDR